MLVVNNLSISDCMLTECQTIAMGNAPWSRVDVLGYEQRSIVAHRYPKGLPLIRITCLRNFLRGCLPSAPAGKKQRQ